MELADAALVLVAGLFAGAANAIADGGSLVSFPALLATGLPPISANVSNSMSVWPGHLAGLGGGRDLTEQRQKIYQLLPATIVGAGLGSAILLLTPPRTFELVVPFLVLGASGLLAFQERLRAARAVVGLVTAAVFAAFGPVH
ncbi:MAG: TSUP family transporter, partial [Haloechinothrix sp.]